MLETNAEPALQRLLVMLKAVVEATTDAVYIKDLEGRYVFVNQAVERFVNKSAVEILGRDDANIFPARDAEHIRTADKAIVTAGRTVTIEERLTVAGGAQATFLSTKGPILDESGTPIGIFGITRDITDKKHAEESLRHSEERYRILFNGLTDAVFVHGVTEDGMPGELLAVNRVACDRLEYTRQELLRLTVRDIDAPESTVDVRAVTERLLKGETVMFEQTHVSKSGRRIPVEINVQALRLQDRPIFLSVVRDISERKKAEEALRFSESLHKKILQSAMDGFWIVDMKGKVLEVNEAYCQMSGYREEELLSMGISDMEVDESTAEQFAQIEKMMKEGYGRFIRRHRRKNGSIMDLEISTHYLPVDGGRFVTFLRDITERRRAQEELERSEEKYRRLVDTMQEGLGVQDKSGTILFMNRRGCEMLGYTLEELVGKPAAFLFDERNRTILREQMEHRWKGEVERYEIAWTRKDGSQLETIVAPHPLYDKNGNPEGAVAVFTDITELKRTEERARQAEKMEVVGQLAGGIAHDFNNILSGLGMQVDLLRLLQDTPTEDVYQILEEMQETVNRAAGLTRQLLLFSRRRPITASRHDLNHIVSSVLLILRRLLGERIELVSRFSDSPLWFEGDSAMVEQVVMNLSVNARDAMPDGGRLRIETATVPAEAAGKNQVTGPGGYARLRVSDSGHGIPPSVQQHIFEPFFTTKEPGKGTGLGLATVQSIVVRHAGWVEVESEEGKGTTFSVYLPLSAQEGEAAVRPASRAAVGGSASILLVEDEPLVRRPVFRCLQRLGYDVVEASNGEEAMEVWTKNNGRFDLLLSDMVMPGRLSGLDLARKLRELKKDLPAIIASGYSTEQIQDGDLASENIAYISKPYDLQTLSEVVQGCLSRASKTAS